MRMLFRRFCGRFLNKQLDFRVRLFNLLAIVGIAISITSTIGCIVNREGLASTLTNLSTGIFAFGLMEYAYRTGCYRRCYLLTIVVIFLIAFPVIFFVGGGYRGGMPCFFVFAVVFTAFMLEGRRAVYILLLELLLYAGICIYGYRHPEHIAELSTELAIVVDNVTGFMFAGVSLSLTMLFHFRMYNQQQRELESARQEAVKLSETKSNFLANMSHEIRTPIDVILGMNEMVLRESESERVTDYGHSIQNAGRTLLTLINNILDITKIESGKLELVEESYRLEDLIGELVVIGRERSTKKGLHFTVEVQKDLPCTLYGGYIHIKQVAINLMSNAVKYTQEGTVALRLSAADRTADSLTLVLSVEDTGIGIKPEYQADLFDAFTRIGLPAYQDVEGTGLGLAIAKDLADLMGGRIHLQSLWGSGSTFSLEVFQRVLDSTPWESGRPPRRDDGAVPDRCFIAPRGKILAVDDNRENLQVIRFLLDRTLLRVDTAADGEECLRMLEKNRYHVILMDYMMPGMDGIETLRRLRAERPGDSTPVIALTANAVAGAERMFLEAGFAGYLSKPVVNGNLERMLIRWLPAELVTVQMRQDQEEWAAAEQREELAALLSRYGVCLERGLRYLGGDLRQYKRLAEFFLESRDESKEEACRLMTGENWENLCFLLHSQKSKSLAVGAAGLYRLSADLEQRCRDKDREYILLAWPLFLLEWERVGAGLQAFILRAVGRVVPESAAESVKEGRIDRLLHVIRTFQRREAELELECLLRSADEESLPYLAEIREAVAELDFERAEHVLKTHFWDSVRISEPV